MTAPRLAACLVLCAALPLGASAASNLGDAGYPSHACGDKPVAPQRPEKLDDEAVVTAYNAEVDRFNKGMETYVGCVQRYVDAAAEDMKRIRALIQQAVEEANR